MNINEFEREVADLLAEFQGIKTLREQLDYLDGQIADNEQQLDDSYIKVPFTHYRFLDRLGIIKHYIPTLLRQNKRLVLTYNAKVSKFQQARTKILNHLKAINDDCDSSPSDLLRAKDNLIEKYFKDYL